MLTTSSTGAWGKQTCQQGLPFQASCSAEPNTQRSSLSYSGRVCNPVHTPCMPAHTSAAKGTCGVIACTLDEHALVLLEVALHDHNRVTSRIKIAAC
jgi:hypothetical protein